MLDFNKSTYNNKMTFLLFTFILTICTSAQVYGSNKVKLVDISTLTLHQGQWTTSRRTKPVPQLQCVGGTVGCSSQYMPATVQCYNKGHDGVDVQWECKANLVTGTQFGVLDVLCEGYDYPDDPYILKGSCGLEYRLDRGGSSSSNQFSQGGTKTKSNEGLSISNMLFFAIVAIFIYAIYKTCLTSNQRSPTEGDYPSGGGPYPNQGYQGGYPSAPPPPSSYTYPDYGANCGSDRNYYSRGNQGSSSRTNFFTGAATGGILGYLFGSRGSGQRRDNYYETPRTASNESTFTSDSATYSASGFGGTRRR